MGPYTFSYECWERQLLFAAGSDKLPPSSGYSNVSCNGDSDIKDCLQSVTGDSAYFMSTLFLT